MNGKAKACIAVLVAILLAAFCLSGGREDLPGDGNGAGAARDELESAAGDSREIQKRIGDAEKSADRIEESAQRSGELADEAEDITRDCQRIIEAIRRRAEENEAASET